jgi:hypothetical protein
VTAPAQHGRHWRTEVIPAVFNEGRIAGSLAVELLEQTAPFEPPTVQFSRADFEFAVELDRAIAAGRIAEQRRLNPSRWERTRRYVKANWTPARAAYVAATGGSFFGALVTWLVTR